MNIIKQGCPMLEFLPECFNDVKNWNLSCVYEIIINLGYRIFAKTSLNEQYLSQKVVTKEDIEKIILKLTKHSIYAFQETIKHGYVTTEFGVRIGLSGECCYDEVGEVKFIKNVTTLVVRIPHEVDNCSLKLFAHFEKFKVKNTLIISPPGAGKTTFIRDIAKKISKNMQKSVLVVDEKNEIFIDNVDFGKNLIALKNCKKSFGFFEGVRNLAPEVIIADELSSKNDVDGFFNAINSGVKVIASAHGNTVEDIKKRPSFSTLFSENLIETIVILSKREGVGTVEGVFDLVD